MKKKYIPGLYCIHNTYFTFLEIWRLSIDLFRNLASVTFGVLLSRLFDFFCGGCINIRILPPQKKSKIGQNNPQTRRSLSFERGLISFKNRFLNHFQYICILLILSGCMVGPNYSPPKIDLPDVWTTQKEEIDPTNNIVISWWEVFQDPVLTKYIEDAKENNYDIQKAASTILQARAVRQIAASSLFPQINADLNGFKTYFSKNGPVFAIGPAGNNTNDNPSSTTGLPFQLQIPQIQNLFNLLFDASWELDLFGKTRRATEQADALIDSSIAQRDDVLISVFAEIATNYMNLRGFQAKQALLNENVQILQDQAKIIEKAFQAGYKNQIDVETVQKSLANRESLIPDTIREIYKSIYALSILTGKLPEALVDELITVQPLPQIPKNVTVGLRSDLLRRRPDIRKAERELAAATASIGVAVASFFPTLSLIGFGGLQSLQLPKLLEWDSKTWGYGADVSMPVYQGGKITGYLRFAQAEEAKAASFYQQTVLNALLESENYLTTYQQALKTHTSLAQVVDRMQQIILISQKQFHQGLINKIQLLSEEEKFVQNKLSLLDNQVDSLFSLVSLYKSLGGGWEQTKKADSYTENN